MDSRAVDRLSVLPPEAGARTLHDAPTIGGDSDRPLADAGVAEPGSLDGGALGGEDATGTMGDGAPSASVPSRLLFIHTPHGLFPDSWRPSGSGRNFRLEKALAPLDKFRDRVIVLEGLDLRPRAPGAGSTTFGAGVLLTGRVGSQYTRPINPPYYGGGRSIDLVIADAIRGGTPVASVQLGIQALGGYNAISWNDRDMPLPAENDPSKAFDKLFSGASGAEVEALRKRVQMPVPSPAFPEILTRHLDLVRFAFALDQTRVASLQLSNMEPTIACTWLNQRIFWRDIAHSNCRDAGKSAAFGA
jgi:hypothetical protein